MNAINVRNFLSGKDLLRMLIIDVMLIAMKIEN